ncbi:MAG TPA: saccharopine dehydrogenase NADP-binding domain-containing protein [Candidatus Nanoarchaeia archaeon]|nr:saccharopine dehydrogenase NADP-binding domain-containing protein [Candidatus Nanoarchaeia archaeon]
MKKPNLLVLGASGGVAQVFLQYLVHHRDFFNKLILLSRKNRIKNNNHLEHEKLDYIYIEKKLDPYEKKEFQKILKKYRVDIVLDLTDLDSIPLLEAADELEVSYINTSMNSDDKVVSDLIFDVYRRKKELNNAVHILCAGMNPGIVNMWVRYGISKFGIPKEIVHFEYDTSKIQTPFKTKQLAITWSPHEFLVENVRDPSGVALGRKKIKPITPNAISHRQDMRPILSPIVKLDKYPKGFTVLHEENLTLSYKYDIPSKFIYSVNDDTMEALLKMNRRKNRILEEDFMVIKNIDIPLEGSDSIGVILNYGDRKVYYFNSINNASMIRTNATYYQVVIGVFAALFTLLFNKNRLKKGVYFTEDLFNTNYKDYVFDNMRVQEFVFKKENGGKMKIDSYNPTLSTTKNNNFKHIHI